MTPANTIVFILGLIEGKTHLHQSDVHVLRVACGNAMRHIEEVEKPIFIKKETENDI